MDNANSYLITAIVTSAVAAFLGVLLNSWIAARRKIDREVKEEAETAELPKIPGYYGQLETVQDDLHQVWVLERPKTTIGRAHHVDIHLHSPMVSRVHAIIEQKNGRFVISDCGSKNGTVVNGVMISGNEVLELHKDDVVEIGQTRLRFSMVQVDQNK